MAKPTNDSKLKTAKPTNGVMVAPHIAHFWQSQNQIFAETNAYTKRWFDRRRDALASVGQIGRKDKASSAEALLTAWPKQSAEILAEDMNDFLALWSACSNIISKGEIEAETEVLEMAGNAVDDGKLPTRIPV